MKIVKHWWQKRQIRERENEVSTRQETILFNIFDDLTVVESVNLFEEVHSVFVDRLTRKLEIINQEKECIEKFLF